MASLYFFYLIKLLPYFFNYYAREFAPVQFLAPFYDA